MCESVMGGILSDVVMGDLEVSYFFPEVAMESIVEKNLEIIMTK